MAWKKQGDAYFADTFDRDALMCSYDSLCGITRGSISGITVAKGVNSHAEGVNSHAEGDICYVNNFATTSEVDTVSDKLKELQRKLMPLSRI